MANTVAKIDQSFDKMVMEHVHKNQRRTICLSVRGGEAVLCGEAVSVDLVMENLEEMTVGELIEAMKVMDEGEEKITFKTSKQVSFPPFRVKFKGRLWTAQKARTELTKILGILGFCKGGPKKFKVMSDEPEGWPDAYSFETFEHPSYANLKTTNDIIESILGHHGVDVQLHPYVTEEPPPPQKRKKSTQKQVIQAEDVEMGADVDPNDNSVVEDDEHQASEAVSPPKKKQNTCAYEELRNRNIAERLAVAKSLGIMPLSKEMDNL